MKRTNWFLGAVVAGSMLAGYESTGHGHEPSKAAAEVACVPDYRRLQRAQESAEMAARAVADARVDLRTSLAPAHVSSAAETKAYVDAYIAYTATKPELAVLHVRALEDVLRLHGRDAARCHL